MTGGYVLGVFPATGEFALGRERTNGVVYLVPHQALRDPPWNRAEIA